MSDLFTKLGIDWRLLIAQVVNFGILVYVLKRFVYTPVITVLEKRRADIELANKQGAEAEARLEQIETEKQQVLSDARNQAKEIIAKAETSAKANAEEIVRVAEQKATATLSEARIGLERERSKMKSEIRSEIGGVVAAAVEKTVGDFLSKEAEEKLKAEAMALIRDHDRSLTEK